MWSQLLRTSEQELHGVPGEKGHVSGGDLDLVPLSCPPTYLCGLGLGVEGCGRNQKGNWSQLGPWLLPTEAWDLSSTLGWYNPGGSRSLINLRLNGSEGGLWSQTQA